MKQLFLTGLIALVVLAVSCGKDNTSSNENGDGGSLKISIQGENVSGRAVGDPSQTLENTVNSFTVYVFNYATGVLEKSQTFTTGLTGQITGLSVASTKRVVVFVNQPTGYPTITTYSDFTAAANMIDLSTQVPGDFSTTGLFMSGEYATPVTLDAETTTPITVSVSRLVAKVRLGTLTVIPDPGLSLDDFVLTGFSIQKARDKSLPLGGLATTGVTYIGGLLDDGSVSTTYLHEYYSLPAGYTSGTVLTPEVYFYVFPNDDTDGEITLFTVAGAYNGVPMYYPFYINDDSGTGTNDGTFIRRNMIYTLNITLRKLGSGGVDPNIPNQEATLEVTVQVADWEGELVQNLEW